MLDELNAIAFEEQITFETRTHPWIVLTKKEGSALESYVVKLFSQEEVENRYVVAKEVFANVMAQEFELSVPKPALINLNTPEFIETLSENNKQEVYSKDYRIKFGTQYISGSLPFNKNVSGNYYNKFEDADSIFAFDNFIYNIDRSEGKPDNIRFLNDEYYLIDHEYSLAITKEILDDFEKENWTYPFANHVFYFFLLLGQNKSDYFSNFEMLLLSFNPDILDIYELQLRRHNFNPPYRDYNLLKQYFRAIQAKSKSFIRLLKIRLSA